MASLFDLSGSGDPNDNTESSKSTLKRSVILEENQKSKKLAMKDVMNVKSSLPLDGDNSKVNVNDPKIPLELEVHKDDDKIDGDGNLEKIYKSSEKLAIEDEINEKIFHPLVEDNNNINANEPETPNGLKVYEKYDKIDCVNSEKFGKSSEKLAVVHETNINTFHLLMEDNNNINVNEPETMNEPKSYDEDDKIDSDVNLEKSESSEKVAMENEINTRNSNESNSDIGVDEQRRNEDDEMENSVEEIIISDDEGDVNVRQIEVDLISTTSQSLEVVEEQQQEEEESSEFDSDEESYSLENRFAREVFRQKRREHYNEEYRVAKFLVNQMKDINEESSEDEVFIISDSNDEINNDNDDDDNPPSIVV